MVPQFHGNNKHFDDLGIIDLDDQDNSRYEDFPVTGLIGTEEDHSSIEP
jgi:hypothetical protein